MRGLTAWLLGRQRQETMPPEDYFSFMPPLDTARLLLRKVAMRDARDFNAYASDPEVARYVLWTAHRDLADTRNAIRCMRQQYRLGLPASYAVVRKDMGRMIGTIGFTAWDPQRRCLEVGYSLAQSCWGQGYAAEALAVLIRQSFRVMRVHRVEAFHDVDNPASGRVMAKCGMQKEGVLRRLVLNKGVWRDVCLWAVLEDDPLTDA